MIWNEKGAREKILHKQAVVFFSKGLCVFMQIALFTAGWLLMQKGYRIHAETTMVLVLVYSIVLCALHKTYGGLDVGQSRVADLSISQILTLGMNNALTLLIILLILKRFPHMGYAVLTYIVQCVTSVLWCMWANQKYFKVHPAKKTAIIYDEELALESIEEIYRREKRFDVQLTLDLNAYQDNMEALHAQLGQMETVFLCAVSSQCRNDLLKFCMDHNILVYVRPRLGDVLMSSGSRKYLFHVPVIKCDLMYPSMLYLITKRAMDLIVSGLMLIVASPFMLGVALAVKLEDGGPVFYKQKRLTRGGKEFDILKFRSMRVDAEKDGVARLASQGDSRITKVGRVIRATRLDELPQLLNILKGDMSLVGPRPERPEIAAQYMETLPEFHLRLQTKAGLTGYAQVHGKYNTTPYDKLQMDLMYIADMSFVQDVKLILQTVQIMLRRDSTEGVQEGQKTANKKPGKSA